MATKPIIILVGPSGAGKSTFLEKVLGDYSQFRDIITYTTRPMRKGESEGSPYHFVAKERFEEMIQKKFLSSGLGSTTSTMALPGSLSRRPGLRAWPSLWTWMSRGPEPSKRNSPTP